MSVISITHPAPLTKLPGQQSHHSGIFKFGSSLVTVCELRKNFGVALTEWRDPGRIIITELSSGHVGFWVDEILDVMESPTSGWGNPPPLIPKTTFSRTLTFQDEIHLYAEFDNLYAIKQIGYLKSYIEQLQKLNFRSDEITTEKKLPALNKNSVNNSDKTDSIPASQSHTNSEKLTTPTSSYSRTTTLINESNNNVISKPIKNNLTEHIKSKSEKPNASKNQNTLKANLIKNSNISTEKNRMKPAFNNVVVGSTPDLKVNISDRKHSSVTKTSKLTAATKKNTPTLKKSTNLEPTSKLINFNPPQSNTNYIDSTEKSDNSTGILLIGLALLLILLAGSFFYLQPDSNPDIEKNNLTTKSEKIVIAIPEKIMTQSKIPTKDNTEFKNTTIQNDNSDNKTNIKKIEKNNNEQSNTELTNKSDSGYSANITNDSDGITITVHTPVSSEQFESLKEKTSVVETTTEIENKISNNDEPETQQTTEEIDDKIDSHPKDYKITIQVSKEQRSKKIAPSTITKEIIHIVVKGDTLWDIAKFYVDDPYRYPELAQLSNIKNPDLIYPGNRVHIIQIFSDGLFLDDK